MAYMMMIESMFVMSCVLDGSMHGMYVQTAVTSVHARPLRFLAPWLFVLTFVHAMLAIDGRTAPHTRTTAQDTIR